MQTITGTTTAHTLMERIPVNWEMNDETLEVTANGMPAGRVSESIPGKLYYFTAPTDSDYNAMNPATFGTAEKAAEWGGKRKVLAAAR